MAKGICMMMMIYNHSSSEFGQFQQWFCSFNMGLYFIVGGILYKPDNRWFIKNFKSLLIPYLIWGIVGVFFGIAKQSFGIHSSGNIDYTNKVIQMISGIASDNYPLWFLVAYFISKSVYDIINSITDGLIGKISQHQRIMIEIALVLTVSALAYLYIKNKPFGHSIMRFDTGLFLTPLFTIGRYLPQSFIFNKSANITLLVFGFVLMTSILGSVFMNSFVSVCSNDFGNIILFFTSTISGTIVMFMICKYAERLTIANRFLSVIGKNSLAIMSTHAFVLYGIEAMFIVLSVRGYFPIWMNIPICIGLLVPCLPMIKKINKCVQDQFVRLFALAGS